MSERGLGLVSRSMERAFEIVSRREGKPFSIGEIVLEPDELAAPCGALPLLLMQARVTAGLMGDVGEGLLRGVEITEAGDDKASLLGWCIEILDAQALEDSGYYPLIALLSHTLDEVARLSKNMETVDLTVLQRMAILPEVINAVGLTIKYQPTTHAPGHE